MIAEAAQTLPKNKNSTILKRIAEKDKTAVKDCIDKYGNFIWTLARKFTRSPEEAAKATEEIFTDIWHCCGQARSAQSAEEKLIARIALRRLIKLFQQTDPISMKTIDVLSEKGAGVNGVSKFI